METLKAIAQNTLLGVKPIRALASRAHVTGIDEDVEQARERVDLYERLGGPVRGSAVLELGPGRALEVMGEARQRGARFAAAADILRYRSEEEAAERGIDYRIYDGRTLPFDDDSFDFVWACYCMQHFRHPAEIVQEITRVLGPGGRLVCRLDLRDHYHMFEPGKQYDCLRHGEKLWRMMSWNRGSFVNRLRRSEWLKLFGEHGFRTVEFFAHEDPELLEQNRHHDYLAPFDDDDLLTYRFEGCFELTS